jgi:Ca2+/Na+ antiporter
MDAIIVRFLPLCFSVFFLVGPSLFGSMFKKRLRESLRDMNVEPRYAYAIADRARKLAGVESKCSAAVTLCIVLLLNSDTSHKSQSVLLILFAVLLAYMVVRAIRDWDHQRGLLVVLLIGYIVLAAFYAIPFM